VTQPSGARNAASTLTTTPRKGAHYQRARVRVEPVWRIRNP